jgi:hypothetical protein
MSELTARTRRHHRYEVTLVLGRFEKEVLEETLTWMRSETPFPGARYAEVEAAILRNLKRLPRTTKTRFDLTLNQAHTLLQSLNWVSTEAKCPPPTHVRKAEANIRRKLILAITESSASRS